MHAMNLNTIKYLVEMRIIQRKDAKVRSEMGLKLVSERLAPKEQWKIDDETVGKGLFSKPCTKTSDHRFSFGTLKICFSI